MSMEYWICRGIGIRESALYRHLDQAKCFKIVQEQLQGENISLNRFCLDDYMFGSPFENLGDFLTFADDTDTLTYGDDGNGESFFYYTPSYPWERLPNEPQTLHEVHERIIDAVSKVCNLSRNEIDDLIDDIYEVGCG